MSGNLVLFIAKRLLALPVVLLAMTLFIFVLERGVPVEPAEVLLHLSNAAVTEESIAKMRQELGTDLPTTYQYVEWLGDLSRLDFGTSYVSKKAVWDEIKDKLPATMQLIVAALVIAVLIAFPLGILSALRKNGIMDYISRFLAFLGTSVPVFWLGFILIYVFSFKLDLFPTQGRGTWLHLVLPSVALASGLIPITTRLLRAGILEQLQEPYVLYAQARGIPFRTILWRHVMKNAMLPVISSLGMQLGGLLSGTVVIEQVFAWPGLGRYLLEAITNRDYPVIQTYVMIMSVLFMLIMLAVDVAYRWMDPRTKRESGVSLQ